MFVQVELGTLLQNYTVIMNESRLGETKRSSRPDLGIKHSTYTKAVVACDSTLGVKT